MATHEGWKNYETWCVNLWLDNEEPLYREVTERAAGFARSRSTKERARAALAEWLKDFVTEQAPELRGLWSDLLTAALSEVDWDEIAADKVSDEVWNEENAA